MPPTTRTAAFAAALLVALSAVGSTAAAEYRRTHAVPLSPGGAIVFDVHGSVTVVGGATAEASVVVTADRDDVESRYVFSVAAAGANRVEVATRKRGSWSSRMRGENLHFEVRVPRDTRVEVETSGGAIRIAGLAGAATLRSAGGGLQVRDLDGPLDAHTSGGGIDVRDVRGKVLLDTSGGGIRAEGVAGDLAAETSGGGIEIAGVEGDVTASTSGGGVEIRDVSGRIVAHSSGGPVFAAFRAGASSGGSLSSSGGGVRVAVDPAARLSVDASSSGGNVTCDLPITVQGTVRRTALRGELNGGGSPLVLRSSGGGIRIAAAED